MFSPVELTSSNEIRSSRSGISLIDGEGGADLPLHLGVTSDLCGYVPERTVLRRRGTLSEAALEQQSNFTEYPFRIGTPTASALGLLETLYLVSQVFLKQSNVIARVAPRL